MDHSESQLDLETLALGQLDGERRAALEAHLRDCAACREELSRERGLVDLLATAKVPVAPGFAARVLGSLPEPHWAAQPWRGASWLWPAAALAVFCSGLLVLATAGESLGAAGSILGTAADFLASTLLAGAGLLGATWKGVGIAVRGALEGIGGGLWSLAGLWALGLFGLYRLLLRPRWQRQPERAKRGARNPGPQ